MAGITLSEAETTLAAYRTAELKVLNGQAYTFMGRSVTFSNLADIQRGIRDYEKIVKDLTLRASGRGRGRVVSPNW